MSSPCYPLSQLSGWSSNPVHLDSVVQLAFNCHSEIITFANTEFCVDGYSDIASECHLSRNILPNPDTAFGSEMQWLWMVAIR